MTRRMRRSPGTVFTHVFLVVLLLGAISILKSTHKSLSNAQQFQSKRSLDKRRDLECRLVHNRPDQCSFVKANCPDEEAGLYSYLQLYFCSLAHVKPLAFIILAIWISILFSTIGIAASDFLCLNLSTIATVMGMSESLAGVTFLAFGNGSPDVFSTFAAFNSHSGSLAIGELMGAAGFITSVVAGSMAITKPFKVAKKAFVRDVTWFTIAAGFSLNFLKDGSLRMWECIVMIGFYVSYVIFVVVWHWWFDRRRRQRLAEAAARLHHHIPDQQELEVPQYEDDEEGRPAAERTPLIRSGSDSSMPAYTPGTPAWVATNIDEVDDETRDQYLAALSSNMRVSRQGRDRRNTLTPIRPSLIGALEFRSVLNALERKSTNAQPIHMRRYSDDGRHILAQIAESQASISHPELLSEHAQQLDAKSSPTAPSGRSRAVSANDASSLRISRDLLSFHGGTPETAIYTPMEGSRPTTAVSDPSGGRHGRSSPSPYSQILQNQLLSPRTGSSPATSPGSMTPASATTATRNGLLAPPVPELFRPSYAEDSPRPGQGAISPGAISPLALVPKLQIPETGHKLVPDMRYTDSPAMMSATHSRPPSFHLPPPSMSPESPHLFALPEHEAPKRQVKWWPYKYLPAPDVLLATLFPGFNGWSEKRWGERALAVVTAPSIFFLTITVPVVESKSDEDELHPEPALLTPIPGSPNLSRMPLLVRQPPDSPEGPERTGSNAGIPQITTNDGFGDLDAGPKEWNRWLTIVQAFTAPLFVIVIIWANMEDGKDVKLLVRLILGSLVFSLIALAVILTFSSATHEPKHKPVMCFLGFLVAVAWISTIASEVVGVLKTFGVVLDISDAILGLTIFAVGNSMGDLVADITVARLGYPVMALSACFGGPMLNILLGIGIGGLYQTINKARHNLKKHPGRPIDYKPYELNINATLLISGATLVITLVFLLICIPLNKWRMDRKIGVSLITIWTISTIVNVVLEVVGIGSTE